jgi:hypothetical protein
MTTIKNDPKNYRDLSVPFANADEANAAIELFYADVAEARNRHRIRDALVVVSGATTYEEGEGDFHTYAHFGDSRNGPVLAAYALGETQAEMRSRINVLAAGSKRRRSEEA